MKKPFYQDTFYQILAALIIIEAIAIFINEVRDALNLLNYKIGFLLISALIIIWWSLATLVKSGKMNWMFKSGYSGRPRRLEGKTHWCFAICILLIAAPAFYNYFNRHNHEAKADLYKQTF